MGSKEKGMKWLLLIGLTTLCVVSCSTPEKSTTSVTIPVTIPPTTETITSTVPVTPTTIPDTKAVSTFTMPERELLTFNAVERTETGTFQNIQSITIGSQIFEEKVTTINYPIGIVTVTNIDNEPGTFTVSFNFYGKRTFNSRESINLDPGESGDVRFDAVDIDMSIPGWRWTWQVFPGYKKYSSNN
jgi:hypothetical protein